MATKEASPSSLEAALTEKHLTLIAAAEETIITSQNHLARVALIYGGQMHFDFTETGTA